MPVAFLAPSLRTRTPARRFFPLLLALAFAPRLPAVIFHATADPAHNTTPPSGPLANSGWQWVGSWIGFQGAVIGPRHFIAAKHIGGAVGDEFVLNGVVYTTTAFTDDTLSDLRIWQVSGTFPSWAPLYRASDEVTRQLIVFGRGLIRGAEVRDVATNTLRGWQWAATDGNLRWGLNVVHAAINGGSYWGALLQAKFDATGGPEEAHLAQNDSSGPVFIHDGTAWKLAGVAAAVDASFNTTNTGAGFNAAIFDARGLYIGSAGNWSLVGGSSPVPSSFYSTRISVRAAWIDGILATTPPSLPPTPMPASSTAAVIALALLLLGAGAWFARRPS